MGKIRGIIFDMDGVLCDSEPFICQAACRMFQEQGLTVRPEDFIPFVGAGEDRYLGGVAEKHGVPLLLPAAKRRTYEIYLELIRGQMSPLPGAVEFINACRSRGLKLAIASAADKVKVEGNLDQIGLKRTLFWAIINGNDITRKKPDPEAFLLAARRLEIPAEGCLVVEDAPNGIRAGRAAGSRCLGLTTSFDEPTLRQAGAQWTAQDLAHVPAELMAELA